MKNEKNEFSVLFRFSLLILTRLVFNSIFPYFILFFFSKRSAQVNGDRSISTKDGRSCPQTKPDHCTGLRSSCTKNF